MAHSSPLPLFSSPAQPAIGRRDVPHTPGALAFLVHSQETVANKMPPDVDNKALARQRRRRTSKEDEDILKAEYLKNPKPDKAARLEIIARVALGEKEVQIWFQNRRQNDRRRSRPMEPSSSASLMSSSPNMSDPPMEDEAIVRDPEHEQVTPVAHCGLKSDRPATPELTSDETVPDTRPEEGNAPTTIETQSMTGSTVEASVDPHAAVTASTEGSTTHHTASSQGVSQARTSWISNRRSASFVRHSEDYAPEVITFPNAPTKPAESPTSVEPSLAASARPLKRAHSFVRIRTNEDGTARIVTDLDKTPSPPHLKSSPAAFSRAAAGLRRSYSAAGLNDRLAAAARGEPSPKMPRTSSNIGRSRDSRAWEFWCDPDSRSTTSLTTRAEQEGSGSAADAIGILRANRKILAQNHARQNTPIVSRHSSYKTPGSSRVKKSRASTISGRFSTKEHKKGGDETESDEFPQTESDKENWEPEVTPSQRRYQVSTPPAVRRARQILGENRDVMSQHASLGALLERERDKRVIDPEQDDELRSFMGGDDMSGRSLGSAEEAGCVEGLLKLSQGQWR
ncbi:Homeobox protein yox1 [Pleosporales sp. CAS-2024a]